MPRLIRAAEGAGRMRVALIAKDGNTHTGLGRYAHELSRALVSAGHRVTTRYPTVPVPPAVVEAGRRIAGIDARAFFNNYPVVAGSPPADVVHVTSQNLATVLLTRRLRVPTVVTVHDIIPYMVRHDSRLSSYRTVADRVFDRLALAGVGRAHTLIAISEFTRQALRRHLGIHPDRVRVVHQGIDHDRFRPQSVPAALWDRYGLRRDRRYLIYVGSEDPRKDLGTLIDALAVVREAAPDVEMIKIGRAHFDRERERLQVRARARGVASAVHFLNDVSDDDLPLLYGLASVCVMPSILEGFGFPALEAMACGTPVVAADTSSLTEVVGDAGVLVKPQNPGLLAEGIGRLVDASAWSRDWRAAGLARAGQFTWERTARMTVEAYEAVGHDADAVAA